MDRKDFLALTAPLYSILKSFAADHNATESKLHLKIPPYLNKGDVIGITCPSGYISLEDTQPAINKLKDWGFEVKIGKSVGLKDFTYAGTDQERIVDFQEMLDDDSIKAILFGRGGYGAVRIIDQINFAKFKKHPKWILGFSDATVFHSHICKNYGIATIHSKMCNSFPADTFNEDDTQKNSIDSIRKALAGEKIEYPLLANVNNRVGEGYGKMVGGNLSILQNLAGTNSAIDTTGKILFIEDVGEYLYSIDRMMWNLKRSGSLKSLAGLIIGNFKIKPDEGGEIFGKSIYDIVLEKVKEYDYPVLFDFPVGHVKENYAIKCGVNHKLLITNSIVSCNEE